METYDLKLFVHRALRQMRGLSSSQRQIVIARMLGADEVVGEIGVLDGGPRTASVTALEETRTLELHRALLTVVLITYPEVATDFLRTLSRRLRSTDELVERLARGSNR